MSGVKTSHSMGGARADRAPSVLQPPIPSHKPLGSGRTLARTATWHPLTSPPPMPPPLLLTLPTPTSLLQL
eukprot:scaffold2398_cov139-Isochrysis_galbana.AAC.1